MCSLELENAGSDMRKAWAVCNPTERRLSEGSCALQRICTEAGTEEADAKRCEPPMEWRRVHGGARTAP